MRAAEVVTYDPYDYAIQDDPYPVYAWLRENAPLYYNAEQDFWALSRHADVLSAIRDEAVYSNRMGVSIDPSSWGPNAKYAMSFLAKNPFGNQASLFTSSGSAARRFRYEAPAGNIGINIGVAAPMAYFPFSGWKDSFFGDMHGQGRDAIEFYTDKKVVVERWAKDHSRKF